MICGKPKSHWVLPSCITLTNTCSRSPSHIGYCRLAFAVLSLHIVESIVAKATEPCGSTKRSGWSRSAPPPRAPHCTRPVKRRGGERVGTNLFELPGLGSGVVFDKRLGFLGCILCL